MKPREIIRTIEDHASLPAGQGDRFFGYAVLGQPFRSGHVLALRRFPASSVGPGYTSVWHRDPQGAWTFYTTVAPELACSRYFGRHVTRDVVTPIDIQWMSAGELRVSIGTEVQWNIALTESLASRALNAIAEFVPETWWQRRITLKVMGIAARLVLRTGKINLAGQTPNGQQFIANPRRVWIIERTRAVVRGADLGPVGPLEQQAHLNEFLVPQRGIFAVATAFLGVPSPRAQENRRIRRTDPHPTRWLISS